MALQMIRPGDEGYEQLRDTFAHQGSPARIARAATAADVAEAIALAGREGLPIAVRSGGHSAAGLSTNDGGLVIDLSPMNAVELLGDDLVRVGTGAHWGDVAAALAPHGLAVSSGDTVSVGVGGLLLGGGIGWMVRKHGLALDHVVAAEVVTAAGDIVRASAEENPDLFWAIRGGGGNLGIVTSFELRATRESDITFARATYDAADTEAVIKGWRDLMRTADDGLTTTLQLYPAFGEDMPPTVGILAAYAGADPAAVEPLLGLGKLLDSEVTVKPYAEVLEEAALVPGWLPIVRNRFADELTDELVDDLLAWKDRVPMMYVELRAVGGAMARVPAEATAFAHRDAEIMLLTVVLGSPADHVPVREEFEAVWRVLEPHTSGAYVNFFSEPTQADLEAAYPAATRARLAAVKAAYDPANLFRGNVNILPAE
ncbi:FAD-binding oxidoreductase [Nonomuraea sediminis]|uniref:FAD-binding oxidoreductase n=1 Tax=Nonomuraea sediminis TaxID=2835864 RepID=UPI001BDCC89E|nr:FAD-binding oxidoreductase [Nonomuraea sediminis]